VTLLSGSTIVYGDAIRELPDWIRVVFSAAQWD
jgi:hypothetical protein